MSSGNGASDWIRLNVGGTIFETTLATLSIDAESMLAKRFAADSGWQDTLDPTGAHRLDRDPVYFRPLLNFLRTGQVYIDDGVSRDAVRAEAEFFQLSGVIDALAREDALAAASSATELSRIDVVRMLSGFQRHAYMSIGSGCTLRGLNLAGLDLSNLDLRGVLFENCNLVNANLSGADLTAASFQGAQLSDADLSRCVVTRCSFFTADLRRASLHMALSVSDMENFTDFSEADLTHADLSDANLGFAHFNLAQLQDANLTNALLQTAGFEKANLLRTRFDGANVYRARFYEAENTATALGLHTQRVSSPAHSSAGSQNRAMPGTASQ